MVKMTLPSNIIRMVKNKEIDSIHFDGGTLCLDFVNTVHDRKRKPLPDYLLNIFDLVAWAGKAGLLDRKHEKLLEKAVSAHPKEGTRFFNEAITFRELLYQMFYTISKGSPVTTADLVRYNDVAKKQFSDSIIMVSSGAYAKSWDLPPDSLRWITAPILQDANDLLLSGKLSRVKECPNCGWLFLDTTKNGKRRWCSMKVCGSNVKALEWYYRNKG